MAIVPIEERSKNVAFRAPYTSGTFRKFSDLLVDGRGILSGLTVTSDGVDATVADGTFVQRGVVVDVQNIPTIEIPTVFPVFLVASNVDQIPSTNVFVQFLTESEFLADETLVLLARFDSATNLTMDPGLSHDELYRISRDLNPFPNLIANGGFEMDQSVATGSQVGDGIGVVGPDAWRPIAIDGTTGTSDVSGTAVAGEFFSGDTGGKVVVTIGDSTRVGIVQTIPESIASVLAGRRISLNAMVKATDAVECTIRNYVGATPSSTTVGVPHTGTGDWEPLNLVYDVPAGTDRLDIAITGTVDQTFYVDNIVMCNGESGEYVPYWPDPRHTALRKTMRIFEVGNTEVTQVGSDDGMNYILTSDVRFSEPKRDTPTISASSVVVQEEGSAADVSGSYTVSILNVTRNGFRIMAHRAHGGATVPRPNHLEADWIATSL